MSHRIQFKMFPSLSIILFASVSFVYSSFLNYSGHEWNLLHLILSPVIFDNFSISRTTSSSVDHFHFLNDRLLHVLHANFYYPERNISFSEEKSLSDLERLRIVESRRNGCLSNVHLPLQGQNRWVERRDQATLSGTTYWINDYMAVGHAMYDIHLIQLLRSVRVDRVIIQRAPCEVRNRK